MAFNTVTTGLASQGAVFAHPVSTLVVLAGPIVVMGKGDSLGFVTVVTVFKRHLFVIFV